jgi:hypothetical protein
MNFALRRWAAGDLEEIPALIWQTWIAAYRSFIPEEDLWTYHEEFYAQEHLRKLFDNPNVSGFVALCEQQGYRFSRHHIRAR